MFENFSFDTPSTKFSPNTSRCHPYLADDSSTDPASRFSACVSPTCTSFSQSLPYSITDLSNQFSEHTIRQKTKRADSGYGSQRSSFSQENSNENSHATSSQTIQPNTHHPVIKRTQRQDNLRLQTDSSHLREISSLVQKMVDNGEQCSLCEPTSSHRERSITPCESDDEVTLMGSSQYEASSRRHNLPYRRSTEVLKGRPGVTKDVRMRKSRSRINMTATGARRS